MPAVGGPCWGAWASPTAARSTRPPGSTSPISIPTRSCSGSGGTPRRWRPGAPSPTRWSWRPSAPTANPMPASCSSGAPTSGGSRSSPTSARRRLASWPPTRRASLTFGWLELHRQVRIRGSAETHRTRRGRRLLRDPAAGEPDRLVGVVGAEPTAGRPGHARGSRRRRRRALRRHGGDPTPASGPAPASCPRRSRCGRAARAACTTASSTAARPTGWAIERLWP